MRKLLYRILPPLILQVFFVFILLVALETYFPGEFWGQLFFGFFGLLFLNIMFDWFLRKFYKIDTEKNSGYSKTRNCEVAQNYLIILIVFALSALGGILSQGNIAHIIWAGIPLSIIWTLLLKYGVSGLRAK